MKPQYRLKCAAVNNERSSWLNQMTAKRCEFKIKVQEVDCIITLANFNQYKTTSGEENNYLDDCETLAPAIERERRFILLFSFYSSTPKPLMLLTGPNSRVPPLVCINSLPLLSSELFF